MDTKVFVKETTTMGVYKAIKNNILTGHFRPGDWIREREIKEMMGVSSTPVREALRMLVQEGVLVSVPHKGVHVKNFSKKELQDFYELRAEIEGLAAELAAQRRTEAQLNEMKEVLKKTETALKGENNNFEKNLMHYNNEYHNLIALASNNQSLYHSLTQMRTEINLLRVMSWKNEKRRPTITFKQHEKIYKEIENENPKIARDAMQEHIWDSAKLVLMTFKENEK